jgi:hypothetical protein
MHSEFLQPDPQRPRHHLGEALLTLLHKSALQQMDAQRFAPEPG